MTTHHFLCAQLGSLDKSTLPGRDALKISGKKEGDTKLILHGGKVEAYNVRMDRCIDKTIDFIESQWSADKNAWEYSGEVTDAIEDPKDLEFMIELDGKVCDCATIICF